MNAEIEEYARGFPKGARVRIGPERPQFERRRGWVYEVLEEISYKGPVLGWMYLVRRPDGKEGHMLAHILEEVN